MFLQVKTSLFAEFILNKNTISAAHCLHRKNTQIKLRPVDVIVLVGAYDLTSKNERGVLQRNVSEIYVHPEWNSQSENYDADLAVLLLSESVTFSDYIQPVCVPSDDTVIDGASGSVVGWGFTENENRANLQFIKHAFSTALEDGYCYTKSPGTAQISSPRMFCGQGIDGSPHSGDSGGGFYVDSGSGWVQHGIVSAIRSTTPTGDVDENEIVIYTNVKKFKSWIVETVLQTGGVVGEVKRLKKSLSCQYGYSHYTCYLHDLNLRNYNVDVTSFTGSHTYQKSDEDVEIIRFTNGTMFDLPAGIGKFFKSLTYLEINENLGTKFLKRSSLKNLENLAELWIFKNDVGTMDGDCLWDLPNLKVFCLTENNLKKMHARTFDYNLKLRDVHLPGNQFEELPENLFTNNVLLEYVNLLGNSLKSIREGMFETNVRLRHVDLSENKLEVLHTNLFKNNQLLKYIDLRNNSLKRIEIDFTRLRSIERIYCHNNNCIDANYEGVETFNYRNQFRNLAEFQNVILSNCSNELMSPRRM